MNKTLCALLGAALALAVSGVTGSAAAQQMEMNMGDGADMSEVPHVPPVVGYAEGERIYFIHTEVSDSEISDVLTKMMGSPVPVVPALAEASEEMLATVYVFTNGVQPDGPRGPLDYQPDVLDRPVRSKDYSPLRKIALTTWQEGAEPRLLESAAEVQAAVEASEVSVERPGVVANMPLLTWPGGQR